MASAFSFASVFFAAAGLAAAAGTGAASGLAASWPAFFLASAFLPIDIRSSRDGEPFDPPREGERCGGEGERFSLFRSSIAASALAFLAAAEASLLLSCASLNAARSALEPRSTPGWLPGRAGETRDGTGTPVLGRAAGDLGRGAGDPVLGRAAGDPALGRGAGDPVLGLALVFAAAAGAFDSAGAAAFPTDFISRGFFTGVAFFGEEAAPELGDLVPT